jgi:hypothetical protein
MRKMKKAYKLLRVRKDGSLGPLFINKKMVIRTGEWMVAECFPTKGFAVREGWHTLSKPDAPHLSKKDRVFCEVEIDNYEEFRRPDSQGGLWFLSKWMKINKVLK